MLFTITIIVYYLFNNGTTAFSLCSTSTHPSVIHCICFYFKGYYFFFITSFMILSIFKTYILIMILEYVLLAFSTQVRSICLETLLCCPQYSLYFLHFHTFNLSCKVQLKRCLLYTSRCV